MLISSSEDYEFVCTKTWSDLVASVNKSYDDGREKEKSNILFIETLKDRLQKLNSIISTKENLAKFLDPLKVFAECASGFISNCDKFRVLVPLHLIRKGSEKLIIEQHKELIEEIKELREEQATKEMRLNEIICDNLELAKDLESYKDDINRLERLLH